MHHRWEHWTQPIFRLPSLATGQHQLGNSLLQLAALLCSYIFQRAASLHHVAPTSRSSRPDRQQKANPGATAMIGLHLHVCDTGNRDTSLWASSSFPSHPLPPPLRDRDPGPHLLHKVSRGMTAHLRRMFLEDARTREWPGPPNSIRTRDMHTAQSRRKPVVGVLWLVLAAFADVPRPASPTFSGGFSCRSAAPRRECGRGVAEHCV
jgi:hypothetical protein